MIEANFMNCKVCDTRAFPKDNDQQQQKFHSPGHATDPPNTKHRVASPRKPATFLMTAGKSSFS